MYYRYVVGFLFNKEGSRVLLVKKNRPEWQKGLLNGIGGKIEEGEFSTKAMIREGIEECGLQPKWNHIGIMEGVNTDDSPFICHIFSAFDDIIWDFKQKEDEELSISPTDYFLKCPHVSNLEFIIPYCLCNDHSQFITIEY